MVFLLRCTKTLKLSFPVNSLKWVKFWTILQLEKKNVVRLVLQEEKVGLKLQSHVPDCRAPVWRCTKPHHCSNYLLFIVGYFFFLQITYVFHSFLFQAKQAIQAIQAIQVIQVLQVTQVIQVISSNTRNTGNTSNTKKYK